MAKFSQMWSHWMLEGLQYWYLRRVWVCVRVCGGCVRGNMLLFVTKVGNWRIAPEGIGDNVTVNEVESLVLFSSQNTILLGKLVGKGQAQMASLHLRL